MPVSGTNNLIPAADVARVAHELNNSLAPAISLLETLHCELQQGRPSAAFLNAVRNSVGEAVRLANELGELTRTSALSAVPPQQPNDARLQGTPGASLPTRHVLYVDDDPNVRTALSLMLRRLNQNVDCADSARKAIELFRARSYDLVITDLQMESMGGEDLCQILKQERPTVPVFLLTGWTDAASRLRYNAGQPDGVLTKPLTLGRLRQTLLDQFGESGSVD